MSDDWFEDSVRRYSKMAGYVKPDSGDGDLRLDSNENLVIPRRFSMEMLSAARRATDARRYPLGGTERLTASLSRYLRVRPGMIGVGNGSDQILDLILSNFASRKTRVLVSEPTFGFFEARCRLYGIPLLRVPFSAGMELDMTRLTDLSGRARMIYLDSPNNPTGFQFPKRDLRHLIEEFDGPVIIDEAYGIFGDYSVASWTRRLENLIVVGTFSKSFGLAGLRAGYCVAREEFIDVFNRVIQHPYPVNSIAIEACIAALEKADQIQTAADTVRAERSRMIETLRGYDTFEVFDSKANFILFDAGGAYRRIHTALLEQGISVRLIGRVGPREGCLRVTVGTQEMNSRFLLAVRDLLQ